MEKVQPPTEASGGGSEPLFSSATQIVIAIAIMAALLTGAAYYWVAGGTRGLLISIDDAKALEAKFLVDINAADWPELAQLPEIGDVLARRIVESREKLGPFASTDNLLRVQGIGQKTLDKMRPYLLPVQDNHRADEPSP